MPSDERERLSDRLEAAVKELGCAYAYNLLPESLRRELEQNSTAVELLKGLSGVRGALTFLRLVQK